MPSGFEQQDVLAVLSSHMEHRCVEGDEDEIFLYREAKQVGIGDLVVAEDQFREGMGERLPVGAYRLVVISRLLSQVRKYRYGHFHTDTKRLRSGQVAKNASFCERAECPLKGWHLEPVLHPPMVYVVFREKRNDCVYIQQILRILNQEDPPKTP